MKLAITHLVLSTATFGLMLAVPQNAQASGLIRSVTATAPGFTINSQGSLAATTNGFGLQGPPLNRPTLTGTHAATNTGMTDPNAWRSSLLTGSTVGNVTINFAFGRIYNLAGFSFWNLGGDTTSANQGINAVTIQYSSNNGGNWTTLTDPGVPASFSKGPATGVVSAQQVSFSPVYATNVRFINMSNHGATAPTNYRLGFNEIQFTSIPEPSTTLALLALGLAGMGLGLRKRI
ncbi:MULTISPECIES: PEP-CTERM sorting domain-containing protein [unclassified Microcystis]|uniref:PEP-CTERM sorting domain-containing protein n=1 Tax=Microcystis flos-aquae Mf_QC_C_20070823_S10D TaxID=2486236 RepID=A0A552L0V4_9CHRO|nr:MULTISPECIES: PEP-CTERM sorting domain-containing protein [unclassified Microcystis]MCA2817019.1 discoidin domain-containing protein [Microcystis sp. M085S1]MCA2857520.1 discoidin domain-containing protein [Microcystis sp. M065S1]TRT95716.1 MAG: PEP-CTERM sorting domain-containing protein [Microcystis flos-aquae Ma_QC_C_20070823_S18D]TRV13856.1 MAG: PEP-CTERM sorting domain-containing protein [Microcystis flos-aquae Mf_QC_C_20070823_S10D]TRV21083.1 MAG: PEP-CTERM sorting domain-containing p